MSIADFDFETTFHNEFLRLTNEQTEATGIQPHRWRAGGRASKQWPNKEDAEWWVFQGPGMCKRYHEWREQSGLSLWVAPGNVSAIELEVNVPFGGVPIRMFIDRVFVDVNGQLGVVDLKTGSREPATNLQLGVYACGMELAFGVRPAWGAYWLARTGELTTPVPLDLYQVDQLSAEFAMFDRAVREGTFLPNRGSHCKACGVAKACAAVGGPDARLYDPLHPHYGKESA